MNYDRFLYPYFSGRGFTLDDPDIWGLITLAIAGTYYLYYNILINLDNYNTYEKYNHLYLTTNYWYLINAVVYVICSLRDHDFFWFMPIHGRFPNYYNLLFNPPSSIDMTSK